MFYPSEKHARVHAIMVKFLAIKVLRTVRKRQFWPIFLYGFYVFMAILERVHACMGRANARARHYGQVHA